MERSQKQARRIATLKARHGRLQRYPQHIIIDRRNYSHPGVSGALFGVSGNVIALHRPYRAVPPRSAFFSTSLHIMTSAAEKAPLLPHCTAFIPLEKQRRRIYKRRKSPPWAQRELPSPLGHFFLQDGAWRAIIFKLARQTPSNLPLCKHAKACQMQQANAKAKPTECESLARVGSSRRALSDFLVESALPHYAPL